MRIFPFNLLLSTGETRDIKRALTSGKKLWWILLIAQILLIPLSFLDVIAIQVIIDAVITRGKIHLLISLLSIVGIILLVLIILDAGVHYWAIRLSQYWDTTIKNRLLRRVLHKSSPFFGYLSSGHILFRILSDSSVLPQYMTTMQWGLVTNAIILIVVAVLMFYYDIALAFLLFGIIPIQIILFRYIGEKCHSLQLRLKEFDQTLLGYLDNVLTSAESIKALGIEDKVRHEWIMKYRIRLKTERQLMIFQSILGTGVIRLSTLMFLIVLGVGAQRVITGSMTIGQLMAFLLVGGRLIKPIQYIANYHLNMQNIIASLQRMRSTWQIHEDKSQSQTQFLLRPGCQTLGYNLTNINTLELLNISFSYHGYNTIFQYVTWKIEPGCIYKLSGKNGTGKSTLLKLIACLLRPNQGDIKVNGNPYSQMSQRSLRQKILYLPGESFWLNGTIEENMFKGITRNNNRCRNHLLTCMEITGCRKFVDKMPLGLDSIITEGGKNISQGEKQRLALTRALLMRPNVLLLDEGMSSISYEEVPNILRQIQEYLGGASTIIYVLHKFTNTLSEEKEIVVCDKTIHIE